MAAKDKVLHYNAKYDYDSEEFYKLLHKYASICYQDKQVAELLELSEESFNRMKNGKYDGWDEKQNEERSRHICQVLAHARNSSVAQAHNTLLKMGLGTIKVKSQSIKRSALPCECKGKDPNCLLCGGKGWVYTDDVLMVQTAEQEVAPSLQALALWLKHHDPNYRKVERGEDLVETLNAKQGVDVTAWLKKEMEEIEITKEKPQVAELPNM